jgi:tRNA pseudouridine55 synthase
MGHGGTLDPMATGVLIVGIGSGTKKLNHLLSGTKDYEATCVFGIVTDSYDAEGKILRRCPTRHVTKEIVERALTEFRGDIMQQPPMYLSYRNTILKLDFQR